MTGFQKSDAPREKQADLKIHRTKNYTVVWNDTARVWEAYRLDGGRLVWIGAYDTIPEANHACHRDEWKV
jgi:hypothetical protein